MLFGMRISACGAFGCFESNDQNDSGTGGYSVALIFFLSFCSRFNLATGRRSCMEGPCKRKRLNPTIINSAAQLGTTLAVLWDEQGILAGCALS